MFPLFGMFLQVRFCYCNKTEKQIIKTDICIQNIYPVTKCENILVCFLIKIAALNEAKVDRTTWGKVQECS